MVTNNSLKEYYIKLTNLYNNALNMFEALNQALSTTSSEVSVYLDSNDNSSSVVRIPSLIYMENRIEQLENNMNNLFNMPSSGEAWFNNDSNMFKLSLVKSNNSPLTPEFRTNNVTASITENNFLKDLVTPKTYLKLNITNLPDNIEKMYMKKIIFNNVDVFNQIKSLNLSKYEEYKAALYNLNKGIEYDEYDSTIDLPIKANIYSSAFNIEEIVDTYVENEKTYYKLRLNTLQYHNHEDTSLEYTLRSGDYLCLGNQLVIYKIISTSLRDMSIIIEENVGHISLQPISDNSSMVLSYYNNDYSSYHYVEVPLEENRFICIFLGTIYNNVRSLLSDGILIDLSTILMYDKFGNPILDSNGVQMSYMDYYNKYCVNIGDLILGLTKEAYPQISNFDNETLFNLQNSDEIKDLVGKTFNPEGYLEVLPINKHLIDDVTTEDIIKMHNQKAEINSQLLSIQENIDNVYSTLVNTDFNQEVTITQMSLRSQLDSYYSKKVTLQKQLNTLINNINSVSSDMYLAREDTKYRIRGITQISDLELYIHTNSGDNVEIIGLECEYKYKSPTKDTTTITSINSNIFTDWNKLDNIDRKRKLVFNKSLSSVALEFEDYSSTQNIIKWNQIDIPIVQGEDVVIRCRYKYNIGQPFVDIYSPWSEEYTVKFPVEFTDNVELSTILKQNDDDVVNAKFMETLINDGYQTHINNSLKTNDVTFYHMPENIYSGFTTAENNLLSLKDKLGEMNTNIESFKDLFNAELNKKYQVSLVYDNSETPLFTNSINKIDVYNIDHLADSFVKKYLSIVIKNTGDVNVKLYSIFPGNTNIPLLLSNEEFYEQYIQHYERVPIFIDSKLSYQTLGQWIYFRQDNPFTYSDIYYSSDSQNLQDYKSLTDKSSKMTFSGTNNYMKKDYSQMLLGYRKRNNGEIKNFVESTWIGLDYKGATTFEQLSSQMTLNDTNIEKYKNKGIDFFMYENTLSNNYLNRFEDICGVNRVGNTIYLDEESSISEFINVNNVLGSQPGTGTFLGAFLYPNIEGRKSILTEGNYNDACIIEPGQSVSIPLVLEYNIDGENISSITKAIYFDLRDSLIQEPKHYMVEVTANYDYTSTGNLINSASLFDEVTNTSE